MRYTRSLSSYICLFLVGLIHTNTSLAQPRVRLKAETGAAFDKYIHTVEQEMEVALQASTPAMWLDEGDRKGRLFGGQVLIEKAIAVPEIPAGLIHEWTGAVFIAGVEIASVVDLLTDYDRHRLVYPEVIDSRQLSRESETVTGYLRLKKKKIFAVVLNTEHQSRIRVLSPDRRYVWSRSTRIVEVADAGAPNERDLPVGQGSGFLWSINTYWGLQQTAAGVLAECRTISLSRSIPWGLSWALRPFVELIPKESLQSVLEATRESLVAEQ